MALFKVKAKVDGEEKEVEVDDSVALPADQVTHRIEDAVTKRLNRQAKSLRGELLKDDDFVNEVLTAKGIDPKTLKGLSADEVARLQEEWRKKEVGPLTEKLTAAEKRLQARQAKQLKADLVNALVKAGVKPTKAERIAEYEATRFGLDEETDDFAVREGDGFAYASKMSPKNKYKGITEFAEEWAADPANADFIEPKGQRGPGLGGDKNRPGEKQRVQIKSEDAKIKSRFDAAEKQAKDAGVELEIVD